MDNKKADKKGSLMKKELLLILISSTHATLISIAPVNYLAPVTRRTTAQIMQGEFARALTPAAPLVSIGGTTGIPVVDRHFTVANYQETGQYGPSAESSAGSTQILVASKGRIRSFLYDGRIDNVLNLSHDSFFSPISQGGFTADPNVIFNPLWKQWIIFANAFLQSSAVLAISDGDPITSSTIWSFYVVDKASDPDFNSQTAFFDYTTLGADAQNVYCALNVLDSTTLTILSSAAYVIPKNTLSTSNPATVYAFRNLRNLGPQNLTPFTIQPALNFDPAPTAGYLPSINLADALAGSSRNFLLQTITFDAQNVPTLSEPTQIPVQNYVLPLIVGALGTPPTHIIFPAASFRLSPTHIRNNFLWLANNIGVDNTGASNVQGNVTRDAVRVTQIALPLATVTSQATLFQATSDNTLGKRSFLSPSIMSNANGKVIVGATICADNERLNAAVAQLINNNTAFGPTVVYTASSNNYYATEDWEFFPFARWGDHTRISPDPNNPSAFWSGQQFCSAENTWGLDVAHVVAT